MKFYNRYYQNCYEELLTYYPDFYKNVYEMTEILKAFGRLSDGLESTVEQTYFNNFILYADSPTVKIWENIFGITYSENLTLDQRKRVVIGFLSGGRHIGEQEIKSLITNYTLSPTAVDFVNGVIKIRTDGEIFDEENLLKTLSQRIPAHLKIDMTIRIRRTLKNVIGGRAGTFCVTRTRSKLIE